jgi:membrane-anchored glycerophosphoryl diester phosphodiesterase (GDPDase)
MSKIRNAIRYILKILARLINGFILFLLSFSGLLFAILLRQLGYNGAIIASLGLLVEGIALFFCYLFFKGYLQSEEKPETPSKKGKSL